MTRPSTPPSATRAAATLALEHGIELATIAGTGAGGKITKGDVAKLVDAGVRGLTPEQQAEWNREHQLRQPVDQVTITPAQRAAVIATIRENPEIGNVAALRAAGVAGTRGQLAQFATTSSPATSARRAATATNASSPRSPAARSTAGTSPSSTTARSSAASASSTAASSRSSPKPTSPSSATSPATS
jgi:hypothetical protein